MGALSPETWAGDSGGDPALGTSEQGSRPALTQPVGHLGLRDSICHLGMVTVDMSQDTSSIHLFINTLGKNSTFPSPQPTLVRFGFSPGHLADEPTN